MKSVSEIVKLENPSERRQEFINGLYELGKQIAYRDFHKPTDAPYEVYCTRFKDYKFFDGMPQERIDDILTRGRIAYERGFADFVGKTYVDEVNEIRKNHLGVQVNG